MISSVIALVLLQTVPSQVYDANFESRTLVNEEVSASSEMNLPRRLTLTKKGWNLTQAYHDVFNMLSQRNTCSSFYGGPRAATTVLNAFVSEIKSQMLHREISFQMTGQPRFIRDTGAGVFYRLFDRTTVNTIGSFYQRRTDPMRNIPSDVGSFLPGSRPARALILLHELGHLIVGEDGTWLIPADGYDAAQSKANTLRVEKACRAQLIALN